MIEHGNSLKLYKNISRALCPIIFPVNEVDKTIKGSGYTRSQDPLSGKQSPFKPETGNGSMIFNIPKWRRKNIPM